VSGRGTIYFKLLQLVILGGCVGVGRKEGKKEKGRRKGSEGGRLAGVTHYR